MYRTCHNEVKAKFARGLLAMSFFLAMGTHAQNLIDNLSADGGETSALPSMDELLKAKADALKNKLADQNKELRRVEENLLKEQQLEGQIFDTKSYLTMSMFNSANPAEYSLKETAVFLDGKVVSLGGELNQGLPRNNQRIFFAPLSPGCHEVKVRAKFIRRDVSLIGRIVGVEREVEVVREQAIIAQEGHSIELDIEAFEAVATILKWYRNPDIRFNPEAKPNFLLVRPLGSLNGVIGQGQVRIDYEINDDTRYHLVSKSVSIDGLPILTDTNHDQAREKNTIFNAPLAEGRHKLQVSLFLREDTKISGGASYNFRLNFERDFDVLSNYQTTLKLTALPDAKIGSDPYNTRYARINSKISSEDNEAFFPSKNCKAWREESLSLKLKEPQAAPKPTLSRTENMPADANTPKEAGASGE